MKLTHRQSDGCRCVKASVGPMAILMPHQDCQINITGMQVQIIIVCRLWAPKRGGATLTIGVNVL